MAMQLLSSAFKQHKDIPVQYTCESSGFSPPLSWSGIPPHTQSLVLIVDDPDAPDPNAPRMTWVHWLLYNIPPRITELSEGMREEDLPIGSLQGKNDWNRIGYGGPCPPIGRHRYFHKLYALDTVLPDLKEPTKEQLLLAMENHVIEEVELLGYYQKH